MAHTVEINVTSQWSFDASKPNLNNVVERKKARVVREGERERAKIPGHRKAASVEKLHKPR